MKPVTFTVTTRFEDGECIVQLRKSHIAALERARIIGLALINLHQPAGANIVQAIDKVLGRTEVAEAEDEE